MSNFRKRTIMPRFLITIGVALLGAAYAHIELLPDPYQAMLGGLLSFFGAFWYLHAIGLFRHHL
ncbi:hypothetical protein TM5383_00072 [Thalassovita mediterranea]|jgi:hypothetical protein|uniref:Uncharacterized protein n=2 Tax=Thalassovita mediterranea TaxID=340021 RepID=A0A0P1GLY8_9RHOB|nr:hypothetical protein TM5383_00072 [Thalassovita mediterranea]SIS31456.1 hypothetical protein SAMN05421685_104200 [Thalassovita mediterranea]